MLWGADGREGRLVIHAKSTVDTLKANGMTKASTNGNVRWQIDESDFRPPTVHFTTVSTDASHRSCVCAPYTYLRWLIRHAKEQMRKFSRREYIQSTENIFKYTTLEPYFEWIGYPDSK